MALTHTLTMAADVNLTDDNTSQIEVLGSGFRVLGSEVQSSGFWVQGLGLKVQMLQAFDIAHHIDKDPEYRHILLGETAFNSISHETHEKTRKLNLG